MKVLCRGLLAFSLACCTPAFLDAGEGFNFRQPQSPARPRPDWLKIIDQGRNDPRLKGYFTPEGIRLEIVADFPTVVNPVGMTFGDDGSFFLLEWRASPHANLVEYLETIRYKDGSKRTFPAMRKRARDKKGKENIVQDLIKVLRSSQGKGVYDKAEMILEKELASSILFHDGWLYLSEGLRVCRYRPSKPGGRYDIKEGIAQGFGGLGKQQVSGLMIGNDGWLYITAGEGDHYVEGSDGSRATVRRTGAVFRCRPDGSKMHVFSLGYRNPFRDLACDATFNLFHVDSDIEDGGKFTGCRLLHVAEASDFGWRLLLGARCCVPDPVRAAVFGELPGKMPPLLKLGRGRPAGLFIYNDTRFPENFRGLLFYPDPLRQSIRAYKVEPRDSTFEVAEEFVFLQSKDPLFRPSQIVLGPDGAMYVCDRRLRGAEAGPLGGDNKHGRIYRLRWEGADVKGGADEQPALPPRSLDSWARILKMSDEDLLRTLASEELSFRQRAQRELVRRGAEHRPALLKLLVDSDQPLRARLAALGALESFWSEEVEKGVLELLGDPEPDLRRLAADALSLNCAPGDRAAQGALVEHLGDPEPAVRRAVALAIGQIAAPGAADALLNEYQFTGEKDVFLHDGLLRALERLGKDGVVGLLDLANSGAAKSRRQAVEGFLALRAPAALPYLGQLLANPELTLPQRAALVCSYSNYLAEPAIGLDGMLSFLLKNPKEDVRVKHAGLEVLSVADGPLDDKSKTWLRSLLLQEGLPLQRGAIGILGQNPAGARYVAGQFLARKLPRELLPDVTEALRKHVGKDPASARLLAKVLKSSR